MKNLMYPIDGRSELYPNQCVRWGGGAWWGPVEWGKESPTPQGLEREGISQPPVRGWVPSTLACGWRERGFPSTLIPDPMRARGGYELGAAGCEYDAGDGAYELQVGGGRWHGAEGWHGAG